MDTSEYFWCLCEIVGHAITVENSSQRIHELKTTCECAMCNVHIGCEMRNKSGLLYNLMIKCRPKMYHEKIFQVFFASAMTFRRNHDACYVNTARTLFDSVSVLLA